MPIGLASPSISLPGVVSIERIGLQPASPEADARRGCAECPMKRGAGPARDPMATARKSRPAPPVDGWPSTLLEAFRESGGVVSGDEFAMLLREQVEQPLSKIAKWIVSRQILSFSSASQTMVPLFQFEKSTLCPYPALQKIIAELNGVLEESEVVEWFARANCALSGARPANCMNDLELVHQAARVDRYVMRGC